MNQSNGNGYINDIFKVGKTNYIEKNEPPIFNTRTTNSLQGIIQETPMSRMFFSNGNIDGLQKTIRYKINQETNKTISYQSEDSLFIIMRSIYLQFANSMARSGEILSDIRGLNKMVIDFSVKNIKDQLDQYDGYIQKISGPPTLMEHPRYENKQNYTYDSSNILG
ncbi:MAG: hypothetical protein CMG46_02905 [Candidatus Marinimicrobia bacterium]|nr:hypothetical protein [Candidatus Neomarinimicrobiota bacterium]